MVLGMAEAEIAGIVGEPDILGDLVQHALVELRPPARHACLELGPPADRAIHEQAEAHWTPAGGAPLQWRDHALYRTKTRDWSRAPPAASGGELIKLDHVIGQDAILELRRGLR